MEKPKKERKFLKAIGRLAKTLGEELVLGIGRKYIGKVVDKIKIGKRQQMTILFALSTTLTFASIDSIPYPITGNKQRLGFNTTGNGLVWRGLASDTVTKPTSYADKNVKAYLVLDSVTGSLYIWKQGLWAAFTSSFTQPLDSLFFDTSVSPNNVDTAKMRWDYDLATVVLGMYDKVPNELGFKNFWLVKNQTGSTIAKGSVVYASGTVGASGRIAVSKFIANGTIEAKLVLGVTAHDLSNGEDGYVIDFGKIRQVNTDTFAAGAILYPSPTTAGAFTDVEPQAPNITMPIAFCINSSSNNGTIAIRVASGYKMHEIQDVDTTGIDVNGGLIYNGSYFVASNGALITASDTASMLSNYATKAYADTTGRFYARQDFSNVSSSTLTWTQSDTLIPGGVNVVQVYRNGQILLPSQYTIPTSTSVVISATSYKIGENYTVIFPRGGGAGSGGVPFDTSVLNLQARLDLKLNISDTAAMLANYATKAYADTTGRFYARQDFTNVSSSTLTWTQSDTLVTGGVNVVQVYRNGQILLPSQYTIPSSTSVVIAATSYKAGENYTVIFPRGGGAGSGGGSGSLTSISAGTGITVSPNPITTTGTVSADLSILMELSDTVSLSNRINLKLNATDTASLSNRINAKLNISDTLSMLSPYFRDADTSLLNLTSRFALKLNATDTASLSNRINAKGTGTVTSVASGYGITGGTITSTGTLVLDSAVVFSRIRDSIVDVAIGNDTIKILKQEYAPATSSVLTWTVTPKFPIQLKAYILVFRNGQLLINDQYNLTDTNKITIVSNSFKLNSNYTVVTVSGIGSVGSAQAGNPVYPDAGIALSTGSTWASSIQNNSSNWNTAYNDKINSLAVTGTTTKTITLTQQDGGTVSGNFTDNGSVTSVDMTVPTGLSISGNPITTNGTLALSYASGYSLPTDANQNNWTIAYNDKIASLAFTGTSTKTLTLNQTDGGTVSNTFTDLQGIVAADTASMLTPYLRKADTTSLNLTSRFATKLNLSDTSNMLLPYLRKADTTNMLLPYFRDTDTSLLNLTSRFATKLNLSDTTSMLTNYLRTGVAASTYQAKLNGTGFVKASGTSIIYDNTSYLPLTGGILTGGLNV